MYNVRQIGMKNKIKPFKALRMSQEGDTLVSIVFSIAAVSFVLVIAYVLISNSLRLGQQAREREQVKNLVQSQVEGLKGLAFTDNEEEIFSFGPEETFCLNEATQIVKKKVDNSGMIEDYDYVSNPDPDLVSMECESFDSLEAANVAIDINYYKESPGVPPDDDLGNDENLFTVTATWDRVGGSGTANEKMVIPVRIHPLRSGPNS